MAGGTFVWSGIDGTRAIESIPVDERCSGTVFAMLSETAVRHPLRPALSFQLKGGPKDRAETLSWAELHAQVTRGANLFRRLGVGETDTVALVLPNATDTVIALLGAMTAGTVNPINPLLEVGQIAAILRETGAKVVVTLAPFPKTDIAQKVDAAIAEAPLVETILEVDLRYHLAPPLSWLIPFLRPRLKRRHRARILGFRRALAGEGGERLSFAENADPDRIAATFHTGGTTGNPKIARHCQRGMVYNGRIGALCLVGPEDVLFCPLPLFHVLAAYPVTMTALASGAHLVLPTPSGYRGEGVVRNFWALVERWRVTLMVMVPTAASALMQRPIRHDVSSLRYAICGSAPLPVELFRRFEEATGLKVLEGYGMTEATCLVSLNPPGGVRKIGSVGLPIPYTEVKILLCSADGTVLRECGTEEVGEICVRSPGVFPGYLGAGLDREAFAEPGHWLRTGDLGRMDADGYIWITGRAKDLIIRGGHNIDPALVEEALAAHPAVAFVGAIGQPDPHAGEVPCAYVELAAGATATPKELLDFAHARIAERAAVPKTVEILDNLPKTAVGKVFKPDLRKRATARIYADALAAAGIPARVEVVEDRRLGLVAEIRPEGEGGDEATINAVLGPFARPWRLAARIPSP